MTTPAQFDPWPTFPPAGTPAEKNAPPVQIEDEQIFCPLCNYNLTGIHSGRCPECGAWFNRAALLASQPVHRITLIPWDDPGEMRPRDRFLATLRICLLRAERFAFAFSVQPQETRAVSFLLITLGLTIGAMWLNVAAFWAASAIGSAETLTARDLAISILGWAMFVPVAMGLAVLGIAVVLWGACPHYDGKRWLRPWLGISTYAAAHFLLIAAVAPVTFLVTLLGDGPAQYEFFVLLGACWVGCTMLCLLTLHAVIELRTADPVARGWASVVLWIGAFVAPCILGSVSFVIAEEFVALVDRVGW